MSMMYVYVFRNKCLETTELWIGVVQRNFKGKYFN